MFSHVFSVAVLASAAVAAPQYYYPAGLSRTIYTGAIAQPAAYASPAITVPGTPAVTLPATANQAGLGEFAALLPSLKNLAALSTAQTPATDSAIDAIDGATASLLTKVPLETIPPTIRGDIEVLIGATQQLIGQNNERKPLNRAELDNIIAAGNNLLASLPA